MGRQNLAAVVEETVIDRLRCDAKDAFDAAESAKIKFHEKFQTYLGTLAGEQFRQGLDSLLEHGMDPEELIQQAHGWIIDLVCSITDEMEGDENEAP